MTKFKFLFLGLGFLLLTVFLAELLVRNRRELDTGVHHYEPLTRVFETTLTPAHDGLNTLLLHFKNPGLVDRGIYKIKIAALVEQEFSGFNVGDPGDLRITFPPLKNIKGRVLTVEVYPPTAEAKLQVGIADSGKLALEAFYRRDSYLQSLTTQIGYISKLLWQDKVFLAIWLSLLGICLIV